MPQVAKEPKVNTVQAAVGRLELLVDELRSLDELIETGSENDRGNKEPKDPILSLSQALDALPKRIDEQINIGLELIRKIKAMII